MKEIPLPLIKANQAGIVLFVVLGIALNVPPFIYVLWLVQAVTYFAGISFNPFAALVRRLLGPRLNQGETQAAELARFNQTIAVVLLTVASLLLAVGWKVAGYIAAAMVGAAAAVALAGYCIGCTMYYQYKRWKALRMR